MCVCVFLWSPGSKMLFVCFRVTLVSLSLVRGTVHNQEYKTHPDQSGATFKILS